MTGKARVCGVMGDGDVCGSPPYHEGDHVGAHEGKTWPNADKPGQKGREDRSRAGTIADQDRDTDARNNPATPKRRPRKFGSRAWFGDRE